MSKYSTIQGIYRPSRRRRRQHVVIAITPELLVLGVLTMLVVIVWAAVAIRLGGI